MSAADEVQDAIAASDPVGGQRAISFERFMDIALYGEHGFYNTGGAAGRRGDFITSPEVGPLFGAVLARALDAWWHELGEPTAFTIVEAGAGPGTLARSIVAAAPECAGSMRYVAVEPSAAQRERHPAGVESTASMPTESFTGVIIANELLDNLPFRLFVMDGGWREAFVVARPDGSFAEVLRNADVELAAFPVLPATAPHGARVPIQANASRWVSDARALLERGRVILIDYATPTTAMLAGRPWREWLRTYRGHDRGAHYLRDPGQQDITADVAIDQIIATNGEPDAVRSQSQFLQRWGIDQLVADGKRHWEEHVTRPDVEAMKMRSRIRESEALLAVPGLGSFTVIEYRL